MLWPQEMLRKCSGTGFLGTSEPGSDVIVRCRDVMRRSQQHKLPEFFSLGWGHLDGSFKIGRNSGKRGERRKWEEEGKRELQARRMKEKMR